MFVEWSVHHYGFYTAGWLAFPDCETIDPDVGGSMAQDVQIPGASSTARIRNPIAVAIFSVITLGIYVLYWWYSANREMVDYGRAKGTDELGDSPMKSLLAVFPGGLIIVPAIWTTFTTFQRVQKAQKLAGQTPINGWLAFVIYIVFSPAFVAYMQSGLNSVWESDGSAI